MLHSDETYKSIDTDTIGDYLSEFGISHNLVFRESPLNIYPSYFYGESFCGCFSFIGDDLDRYDSTEKLLSRAFKDRFERDSLCPVDSMSFLCVMGKIPKGNYIIAIKW